MVFLLCDSFSGNKALDPFFNQKEMTVNAGCIYVQVKNGRIRSGSNRRSSINIMWILDNIVCGVFDWNRRSFPKEDIVRNYSPESADKEACETESAKYC